MSQLTSEQFEALWEQSQAQPVVQPAPVQPVQVELSLSRILQRYQEMAERSLAENKIQQADYDEFVEAVARLKPILQRIDDAGLVAQEMAQRSKARRSRELKKRLS